MISESHQLSQIILTFVLVLVLGLVTVDISIFSANGDKNS